MIAVIGEGLGTAYQDVDVRELQRMLRRTGHCVAADGTWGPQTGGALAAYASSVGMSALVRASARASMIQVEEGILRKLATDTAGIPDLCSGSTRPSSGGGGSSSSSGGGGSSSSAGGGGSRRRTSLWRRRGRGLGRALPWILAAVGAGTGVAYILSQDEEEEEGLQPEEAWI